ncbi:response regulator transcription factor [bacterium]|nr:response regulator transcription factor [bacterium]
MKDIIFVEDDPRFATILKKLLEKSGFEILNNFSDGESFLKHFETLSIYPSIFLFDLELPGISGLDIIRKIAPFQKDFNMLILTSFSDENRVFDAIKSGASGYILKKDISLKLKDTLLEVEEGGIVIEPILAKRFLNYFKTFKTLSKVELDLSEDELDLLYYLVKGFTYQEIADMTKRTHRNVKYTLSNIYKKLNVKSRVEAVSESVRLGVISI